METTRLDELSKEEWFDVAQKVRPGLTREVYEGMWEEFCDFCHMKELH